MSDSAAGRRTTDVVIIGDGIIGLSTALELARRGAHAVVFGAERPGVASFAAAGLLAPTIGQLSPSVRSFFEASLRLYPALLASLSHLDPGLALTSGLLVVDDGSEAHASGERLSPDAARRLEPGIDAPHGAMLLQSDGAVDNVRLVRALRRAVALTDRVQLLAGSPVTEVELRPGQATVAAESGARVAAPRVVLSAGAWSPAVRGLPRPVPVIPLKGQMLSVDACPISRAVMGNGVYLVPRGGETIIGSTSEHAGFDVSTAPDVIERLRAAAAALCPALGTAAVAAAWAGIRPATPDMLPILGQDPEHPELLYSTGHSRNGILLAPASAVAVAEVALGKQPSFDLSGFGIARFGAST